MAEARRSRANVLGHAGAATGQASVSDEPSASESYALRLTQALDAIARAHAASTPPAVGTSGTSPLDSTSGTASHPAPELARTSTWRGNTTPASAGLAAAQAGGTTATVDSAARAAPVPALAASAASEPAAYVPVTTYTRRGLSLGFRPTSTPSASSAAAETPRAAAVPASAAAAQAARSETEAAHAVPAQAEPAQPESAQVKPAQAGPDAREPIAAGSAPADAAAAAQTVAPRPVARARASRATTDATPAPTPRRASTAMRTRAPADAGAAPSQTSSDARAVRHQTPGEAKAASRNTPSAAPTFSRGTQADPSDTAAATSARTARRATTTRAGADGAPKTSTTRRTAKTADPVATAARTLGHGDLSEHAAAFTDQAAPATSASPRRASRAAAYEASQADPRARIRATPPADARASAPAAVRAAQTAAVQVRHDVPDTARDEAWTDLRDAAGDAECSEPRQARLEEPWLAEAAGRDRELAALLDQADARVHGPRAWLAALDRLPPIRLPIGPAIPWRLGLPLFAALLIGMTILSHAASGIDSQATRLPAEQTYPVQQNAPLFSQGQQAQTPGQAAPAADARGPLAAGAQGESTPGAQGQVTGTAEDGGTPSLTDARGAQAPVAAAAARTPPQAAAVGVQEPTAGFDVLDVAIKLVAVLGLAYGSLALLKRAGLGGARATGGGRAAGLEMVSSLALAPNRSVHMISTPDGRRLLVGVTPNQVNLIADLGQDGPAASAADAAATAGGSFVDVLAGKLPRTSA